MIAACFLCGWCNTEIDFLLHATMLLDATR